MPAIKGHCLCGKVTYSSTATEPAFTGVCHCADCRRATGSAYSSVLAVPSDSLTVTGSTTQYDGVGDSGQATHRSFCPSCGSLITHTADMMQGLTMLAIGTMDDAAWVKPAMQIYCDSALPWSAVSDVQSFPKMPG